MKEDTCFSVELSILGPSRSIVGFWYIAFHHRHGFAVKSTMAEAIVGPATRRYFTGPEFHPTTFREEPFFICAPLVPKAGTCVRRTPVMSCFRALKSDKTGVYRTDSGCFSGCCSSSSMMNSNWGFNRQVPVSSDPRLVPWRISLRINVNHLSSLMPGDEPLSHASRASSP